MTPDIQVVAAAALGCPLIANLTGGRFGEVATYLPGRRIQGVRAVEGELEIHVIARWDVPLPEVADAIRAAVAPHTSGMPVSVFIDDIEVPGAETADGSDGTTRPALEEAGVAAP